MMLHFRPKFKPMMLLLPVGLGIAFMVLLGLAMSAGLPVQAQPPAPDAIPPEAMAMAPRAILQDQLLISVDYANDLIEETYAAPIGTTVWITVENEAGHVKATAELEVREITWWDAPDNIGFSTRDIAPWVPAKPDIQPGDIVHAGSELGETTSVEVGEITGNVDKAGGILAGGILTGTIDARWITTGGVQVLCRVYDPVTGLSETVFDEPAGDTPPDGQTPYECDFGAAGWTLMARQLIAVSYDALAPAERDNRVLNFFAVPGPYLQIKTWATGAPGVLGTPPDTIPGNFVLNVEYRNQGTETATGVEITGMLSELGFLSSTAVPDGAGTGTGPIVWDLGPVAPGEEWTHFQVFVEVTGNAGIPGGPGDPGVPGDLASATMTISSDETNMGLSTERTSTWSGNITNNGAWFTMSKAPWTRHPLPGTEFVYTLNVCNAASRFAVDSTMATVTDTLPTGTTLVDWWSSEEGWTEEPATTLEQLVISRSSIAARGCTQVYVRVALDATAQEGDELCNHAIVDADNFSVTTSNEINRCHTVGAPQANLAIHKEGASGMLVPGGHIVYNVRVHNTGNVAIDGPVMITETLPAGTSYNSASFLDNQPFEFSLDPPHSESATQIVWEITDGIDAGYWTVFQLRLDIADTVTPGTSLENTITIGKADLVEDDMTDNVASWQEQVNASGPNLRVIKTGTWDDKGMATRRLSYEVAVQNVGDEIAYNPIMTDTYDSRLTRDLSLYVDAGFAYTVLAPTPNQLRVQVHQVEPGDSVVIRYGSLYVNGAVPPGLSFTNTAEVTLLPRDTDPTDNVAVNTNTTGPDLAVTKSYLAGITEPGEVITYSIAFGNERATELWWWGLQGEAVITDTLPLDMTFVSSELCDGWGMDCIPFPPDSSAGGVLVWNVGSLAAAERWVLRIAAELPEDAEPAETFINSVEIASTEPALDAEADMANNVDQATVTIGEPGATYTLTVNIVGQGTVAINPDTPVYEPGAAVTLTATPAAGWVFSAWSGDVVSTNPTFMITMEADTTVTATFIESAVEVEFTIYLPLIMQQATP